MNAPQETPATHADNPQAVRRRDIAIIGYGLASAAGDEDFALYGAVGTRLSASSPDPVLEAPSADGTGYDTVITCPATDSLEIQPHYRMTDLWSPALEQALANLTGPAADETGTLRIVLITPPADTARGEDIDAEHWQQFAAEGLRLPESVEISVQPLEGSLMATLADACDALEAGECDTLVFGAVDSLLDDLSTQELALARRLKTTANPEGIVPGEGVAFLVLKNVRDIKDMGTVKSYLRALAHAPEPHHGKPDVHLPVGLARAVRETAAGAGQSPAALHCVVAALAQERAGLLEWHHASRQLWPERLDEDQRAAMQQGELDAPQPEPQPPREILDLAMSVGDTGIAAPLLGMVVACARFAFPYPVQEHVVVCETGDRPTRGAAWIERGDSSRAQDARASAA